MAAKKKCKFTVKNKDGKAVNSILYEGLENYYSDKVTDLLELQRLYNQVSRVSKDGDKLKTNKALEIFITELGLPIEELYDENNQLLATHAIKFLE